MNDDELLNQYHDIIFDLNDPINEVLIALSARINPTSNSQHGWWEYTTEKDYDKRCLICGEVFVSGPTSIMKRLGPHGMRHLKEHNLLAFV